MKINKITILFLTLLLSIPYIAFAEKDYIIGVEDVLEIAVWDNANLTRRLIVRPDGKITFPLIDDVLAAGKSSLELKIEIVNKLKDFISNPDVSVIVAQINSFKIFALGEVKKPGNYSVSRETTLLQFLSMAGGFTGNEDLLSASLIRKNRSLNVDFIELIENANLEENLKLEADDILFIPDNFKNRITVVGEVNKATTAPFRLGMTVLDAVLYSGGLTEYAKASSTKIFRKKVVTINELKKIKKESKRVKLLADEVVERINYYSPKIRYKDKDLVDKVIMILNGIEGNDKIIKSDKKEKTIKKRVKTADERIEEKLERVETTEIKEEISVDLKDIMEDGDLEKNILLKPGDIIIVPRGIF